MRIRFRMTVGVNPVFAPNLENPSEEVDKS